MSQNDQTTTTKDKSNKSPAFQFYPAEYLIDENVQLLTLAEEGAYIRALAYCWRQGSIPADPEKLARLLGKDCSTEVATVVQRLFKQSDDPARLVHKRLDEEREKQQRWAGIARKAGKASAEIRRTKSRAYKANGRSTGVQHDSNSSSSFTSSSTNLVLDTNVSKTKKGKVCKTEQILESVSYPPKWGEQSKSGFKKWVEYRTGIKKPLTVASYQAQIDEYATDPKRFVDLVNRAIKNGWQGLCDHIPFADGTDPPPQKSFRKPTFEETNKQLFEEIANYERERKANGNEENIGFCIPGISDQADQ